MEDKVNVRCLFDKMVPVSELKPHALNRNDHPASQIDQLAKIIKFQGWRHPIIVSKLTGFIVAGHGRLAAAKRLNLTEVPVSFQEFTDSDQEYIFLQSDNAIALQAELDLSQIQLDLKDIGPFDIDLLGIKDFKFEPDVIDAQCDEDEVPEKVEPRTKRGDIYRLGNHRLMCGDSTSTDDFSALMDGDTAEICFTSPPYADQREYNGGKELSTEHLATFIRTAFGACRYFAVNLGYSRKDGEVNPYWDDYIKEAKACGLKLLSWNIWDKGECGSIGNQTAMFGISHEWIFVFGPKPKELFKTVENKSAGYRANHTGNRQANGSIKKGKDRLVSDHSQLKTVYNCTAQKARDDIDHPARFPVQFPEGYIEAMTTAGEVVYEPFGGSGTTMIAAEKLNRRARLMELDPHYCDVIVARWEKFTGQKAELING